MKDELFTPEKVRTDAIYAQKPETLFIASNRPIGYEVGRRPSMDKVWHIGVRKFSRYSRSNLIAGVSYVTKCSGKALGGAYGYASESTLADDDRKCSRCFK